MKISVEHDFKEAEKWMNGIRLKQLPFATKNALNDTRDRCKDAIVHKMIRKLDRPTPFTINAFDQRGFTWATKRRLTSILQMKQKQASYLYPIFYGGSETDTHAVPGKNTKLNQYGNMKRGRLKTLKGSKDSNWFYGVPKGGGPKGFYQRLPLNRRSKSIRLVAHFPGSRSYRPLIDFEKTVQTTFDKWFEKNWERAFDKAMRGRI